ncbi:ShlB/FhaC/HecB family hemolysin secretion/activation protein [Methylomonas sp. LWB]|uniref:ShlB/FhaC/HecB family hemolysin secretion/activation protein n=1 Tax=Methylomonas sp. LWB TaxID=1905845 RepID=UPI0009F66BC6|nr:ShlB/FhaC/HecB family hemolysin secretion/activation protein [Methylomonas sp. LWB]
MAIRRKLGMLDGRGLVQSGAKPAPDAGTVGPDRLKAATALAKRNPIWSRRLGIGLVIAAFATKTVADEPPPLNADPTKSRQPTLAQPERPAVGSSGFVLPELPKSGAPASTGGSVELQRVIFDGNTVFEDAELQSVAAAFLHRRIGAADIEMLRRAVSQYYIDHGYINSGAVLASQSLADGVLHLNIVEGRLTEVRQSGQQRLREAYLRDRLLVGAGEPLRVEDLQDSYRQLLADPLIQQLNGRLVPGEKLGEAILDLRVERARPYQLYLGADDYQTPAVGAYTGRVGGWVDNLLTLGERIDGQFIVNEGVQGYNTGISVPLTARDLRASFRYSDTYSSIVEPPLETLNITNHIVGFEAGLSHPIYRRFNDDLTFSVNMAFRENRSQVSNTCQPISGGEGLGCATQASVMRIAQHFSHRGEDTGLVFWSTFNVGLDMLGATTNRPGLPSGQFFSWLGQSLFSVKLLENGAALLVKANIQLADKPLLNLERYALGGAYTVRGYRENTYVRDNGFNVGAEVKYPLYLDVGGRDGLHLVPFIQYGGAWDSPTATNARPSTHYLYSAGIGLQWQFRGLTTEFYWAHAFTPVPNRQRSSHSIQDDGIHFRVNFNVF